MPDPHRAPAPTARSRRRTGGDPVDVAVCAATREELRTSGYDALTLSSVARRARLPRETVFGRWRSKQHLVMAAIADLAERQPAPATGRLHDDLTTQVRSLVDLLDHPGAREVLTALVVAAQDSGAAAVTLQVGFVAERRLQLRRSIEREQRTGRYPASLDPRAVADAIIGALCYRALIAREPLDDAFARQVVALALGVADVDDGPDIPAAGHPSPARSV